MPRTALRCRDILVPASHACDADLRWPAVLRSDGWVSVGLWPSVCLCVWGVAAALAGLGCLAVYIQYS